MAACILVARQRGGGCSPIGERHTRGDVERDPVGLKLESAPGDPRLLLTPSTTKNLEFSIIIKINKQIKHNKTQVRRENYKFFFVI
jgi:hypothetical protein